MKEVLVMIIKLAVIVVILMIIIMLGVWIVEILMDNEE